MIARKIFHIVDRHDESDKATLERKWKCQQTWDQLYETGQLVPAHFWKYPRNAKDALGDQRPLPYLRDLIAFGMNQCGSDDILFFSNDDNLLHPEIPSYLLYHLSCLGPCSIFRTEFRSGVPSLDLSPADFGRRSTEKHVGRDGFAWTKAWLEDNWDSIPDAVLGASMWDVHMACIVRLNYQIKTTNKNIWEQILPAEIPLGYTGHIAHQSAWSVNQMASPANRLNGQLFLEFARKHLPYLKVTPEGNLA